MCFFPFSYSMWAGYLFLASWHDLSFLQLHGRWLSLSGLLFGYDYVGLSQRLAAEGWYELLASSIHHVGSVVCTLEVGFHGNKHDFG